MFFFSTTVFSRCFVKRISSNDLVTFTVNLNVTYLSIPQIPDTGGLKKTPLPK